MGFRTKIVIVGVLQLVVLAAVLFWAYTKNAEKTTRDSVVQKARSVVLTTESMREQAAKNWEAGINSPEQLAEWARQGKDDLVVQAVPVVTAWRAAMAKADEGGYEFRVPKFSPRNPANLPDDVEARVLKKMKDENLTEYHEYDEQLNAIRYFRPIALTEECLYCHGDPSTSVALWGNDSGFDPTGAKMEGWGVGEIHGAFEVVQSLDEADAALASSVMSGAKIVGVVVIIGGLVTFFVVTRVVVRSLIGPVKDIAHALNEGADQVTDASGQVAAAASLFAEGASQQAASLEETSSSLEELASVSRTNAADAKEANEASDEARDSAKSCEAAVVRLNAAMEAIDKSSGEISKIIRAIEEIAFQTNLLALNAAVEAARAGDHGKGFAVVAGEVRNLAQRAADSAKETSDLISNSIERTAEGTQVAEDVKEAMESILGRVQRVSELVGLISDATQNQADGVEQISSATAQIDHVTQQNASASEESASASEELAAQAQAVKSMVTDLVRIVGAKV